MLNQTYTIQIHPHPTTWAIHKPTPIEIVAAIQPELDQLCVIRYDLSKQFERQMAAGQHEEAAATLDHARHIQARINQIEPEYSRALRELYEAEADIYPEIQAAFDSDFERMEREDAFYDKSFI